jgi:hypothetical protein
MNFVFNTGTSGSPQTVDVRYATTDKFYLIKSNLDPDEGKNMVVDATEDYAGLPVEPAAVPGDVNGDGKITKADVDAIADHVMRNKALKDAQLISADVKPDNAINVTDITRLAAYYNEFAK